MPSAPRGARSSSRPIVNDASAKYEALTQRICESVAVFAGECGCGHRSLSDYGQTLFVAWDSADGRNWTVEIAHVEGEGVSMPAGARRTLELEAEPGFRGTLEQQLIGAFAELA